MDSGQQLEQLSNWDLEPHKINREQIDPEYKKELEEKQKNENPSEYIVIDGNALINNGMFEIKTDDTHIDASSMWNIQLPEPPPLSRLKQPKQFIHKCIECNIDLDFNNIICDKCIKPKTQKLFLENEDPRHSQLIFEGDSDA